MGWGTQIRRTLGLPKKVRPLKADYTADNLAVRRKNLGFMSDPVFVGAWAKAVEGNLAGWNGAPPDIRWRAHTALWAARHAMKIEGDFVEAGVFLGFFSLTICHALDFEKSGRKFYLFDTFEGLPDDGTDVTKSRNNLYFDCLSETSKNFAPFPNAKLVQGVLPESLTQVQIERIAYLSIDLNHAAAEIGVISELWARLSPSALVLLDDYAFATHEDQYEAWNAFAARKGVSILTIPTGQGLIIKP
jgi:hypothetical protein